MVIPARGGSKGVHRKNELILGGKPLFVHAVNTALNSIYVDRVVVSSEDRDILATARGLGEGIAFPRPPELAGDRAPLIEVNLHAFRHFEARGIQYDAVISFQPTCPFLSTESMDRGIELFAGTGCDSVVSIAEIVKGHPYIAKRRMQDGRISDFSPIPPGAVVSPRQSREKAYYLTGGFYIRSRNLLARPGLAGHGLGEDPRGVVVSEIEAVDINSELDVKFVRFLFQEQSKGART